MNTAHKKLGAPATLVQVFGHSQAIPSDRVITHVYHDPERTHSRILRKLASARAGGAVGLGASPATRNHIERGRNL